MPGETRPAEERRIIDSTVARSARVHDYWLGGKDNISQVVSAVPYSGLTVTVQARHRRYSKIKSFVVRNMSGTSLGSNARFIELGFLTLT